MEDNIRKSLQIKSVTPKDLEQFNDLLTYVFQVTQKDLEQSGYEEAIDLAIENKIELGYTNYCFDLCLILHKEDYFDIVQNQDAYADKLRQVFGLAADANIKKEKRVTEIVNQIGLSDIKNAIQRVKKISEDNQGKEANKTPKENRYYDNPDTQMHVLLQFLFAKVGINIDALG